MSPPRASRTLRRATRAEAERTARTCYDHLAGKLGVAVCDALLRAGAIAPDGGRAYARPCLDWSERRPHLAGTLGAAVADTMLERDWVTRVPQTRALRVTDAGREGLREALGLDA